MLRRKIRIAVEGCCHGMLNQIYSSLPNNVDLLLICGDFQAIRNETDLKTMAVPDKYKVIGDFSDYYSGKKKAPVLTIFIGGNHECSSYLKELKFGGWVADNIYYMGEFGSVWYEGIHISGLSGIFNSHTFGRSINYRDEELPYTSQTLRSIYHVKPKNYLKMLLLKLDRIPDIILSHDWPRNIERYGNLTKLLKQKKHFKKDVRDHNLGSPLNEILLSYLTPRYWFSSHLHVRFSATYKKSSKRIIKDSRTVDLKKSKFGHQGEKENECIARQDKAPKTSCPNFNEIHLTMEEDKPQKQDSECIIQKENPTKSSSFNSHEIELTMEEEDPVENEVKPNITHSKGESVEKVKPESNGELSFSLVPENETEETRETYFLALDKCLPRRRYLEIIGITPSNKAPQNLKDGNLYLDRRAVAINKVIETNFPTLEAQGIKPNLLLKLSDTTLAIIKELDDSVNYELKKLEKIPLSHFEVNPNSFHTIAPKLGEENIPLKYWNNNQTEDYCKKFDIPHQYL